MHRGGKTLHHVYKSSLENLKDIEKLRNYYSIIQCSKLGIEVLGHTDRFENFPQPGP